MSYYRTGDTGKGGPPSTVRPLTDEQRELAAKHHDLVWWVLRKFFGHLSEDRLEELSSPAFVELVNAASRFDPENGTKFITYAARCIHLGTLAYIERHAIDHWDTTALASDALYARDRRVARARRDRDNAEEVRRLLRDLEPRDVLLVALHYGLFGVHPMTDREIGRRMGYKPGMVSWFRRRAIRRLAGKAVPA